MNLYERARKDNAKILNSQTGFTVPVVLTAPSGNAYNHRAFFVDTNLEINPATGLPMIGRKTAMSISIFNESGALVFSTENPAETAGKWKVAFTSPITGVAETMTITDPLFDRTLGQITFTLKKLSTKVIPAPVPEGD